MQIPKQARQDIFDGLRIESIEWSGELNAVEFLSRLFDLQDYSSHDRRYDDAYTDIWQHTVSNPDDWPDDWIYTDGRFDFLNCDDQTFLQFLCEILHPVVRPLTSACYHLCGIFNDSLRPHSYEIVARTRIAGRPVFAARQTVPGPAVAANAAKSVLNGLNTSYVAQQLTRMESSIEVDPSLAIGTAKELVETCCKTILEECKVDIKGHPELPKLMKLTSKQLELTPEDIPERAKAVKTIRRLLSNLATITQGIAELRNEYGTGHGKGASVTGLRPRHAKLAVGAATTLAIFLLETHEVRRS